MDRVRNGPIAPVSRRSQVPIRPAPVKNGMGMPSSRARLEGTEYNRPRETMHCTMMRGQSPRVHRRTARVITRGESASKKAPWVAGCPLTSTTLKPVSCRIRPISCKLYSRMEYSTSLDVPSSIMMVRLTRRRLVIEFRLRTKREKEDESRYSLGLSGRVRTFRLCVGRDARVESRKR